MNRRLAFCTTCKGRAQHLKETLPRNIADNPDKDSIFVVLDYNSQDDLLDYLWKNHDRDMLDGKLIVYSYRVPVPFHMAHAKNMVARLGILEGADILVTVDADNFTGPDFDRFVTNNLDGPEMFLCPDFPRIKSLPHGPDRPQRGYAGRLAIRSQDFIKMGGYDETYDTWRGEDIDMIARLQRTGYAMRVIPNHFLNAIPHNSKIRFREYPHARQYENKHEFRVIYNGTKTVVNEGKLGRGTVFNIDDGRPVRLTALPTRVFGIGLHKTATSSLHAAFKVLGYDSFHWETNKKVWRIWNEMTALGRSTTLERYYSACDLPIPMLYRQLDVAYPGSKFILTLRDEEKWIKSVEKLWDPKTNPWYDWDVQPFSNQIHQALYGRTDFDAPTFLARYRRHNAEVMEYFKDRPEDLLVVNMDVDPGWSDICHFLGVRAVPQVPYPRINESKR